MHPHVVAILLVACSSMPLAAQRPIPSGEVQSGTLSFDGRATLGDFKGITTSVRGAMTGGEDLRAVRGWVEAPVNSIKTGNGKRDRDMNASLESNTHPTIRFDLDGVVPRFESPDSAAVILNGRLTIHGVAREVGLPATLGWARDGIRVRSDFPLNLHDYRIGGLSKMLGMLKMSPDITVHVDVLFAVMDAPPSAAPAARPPTFW